MLYIVSVRGRGRRCFVRDNKPLSNSRRLALPWGAVRRGAGGRCGTRGGGGGSGARPLAPAGGSGAAAGRPAAEAGRFRGDGGRRQPEPLGAEGGGARRDPAAGGAAGPAETGTVRPGPARPAAAGRRDHPRVPGRCPASGGSRRRSGAPRSARC